jgi:hypothetical protein
MIRHESPQNNRHIHDYGYRKCNSLFLVVEGNLSPSSSCPYSVKCVEVEFVEFHFHDPV